jgi:hypothetical protein
LLTSGSPQTDLMFINASEKIKSNLSGYVSQPCGQLLTEDYGIKQKPIMVKNPQANAIIEQVHQTIGNMICTFNLEENIF